MSSGQPIPVKFRLATALLLLTRTSYLDVMPALGVGRSTIMYVFNQVRILRPCERRGE